ncbi:LacI family DNA-binding transcriptional regulator [Leifsonia poae]|uniref:LacI family DNA-binding transcriptional regulator n=1 Tax=Leifsonia poae TaxID=110933 RepID=UPI001CBCD9FA|nr:LacI family DNA-binding transcriptional regulator [Leifsonia poae]
MPTKKPSGIAAVAEEAGVSVSTVSQVLGGNRPVSAQTRTRVEAAIDKLDYRPHPGARSLRSHRTESVALIVPDITNPFYPLVAAGMQDVLLPAGYLLSVNDAALPSANIGEVLRHVLARRVDGIALGTYGLSEADLARIADSGTRVVALGRDVEIAGSDYVESDDESGFAKVVEHLLSTGRRRIAFIGGEENAHPNVLRLRGYRSTLSAAGHATAADDAVFTAFTREGGREGVDALFARNGGWDAVVCANDLIAIGAIERLRELGRSVPGDVAVTGYDDIDAAALISPSLTTVENPAREIGRTAARLLLTRFAETDEGAATQHITLSNRLVIRGSTAPTPQER